MTSGPRLAHPRFFPLMDAATTIRRFLTQGAIGEAMRPRSRRRWMTAALPLKEDRQVVNWQLFAAVRAGQAACAGKGCTPSLTGAGRGSAGGVRRRRVHTVFDRSRKSQHVCHDRMTVGKNWAFLRNFEKMHLDIAYHFIRCFLKKMM